MIRLLSMLLWKFRSALQQISADTCHLCPTNPPICPAEADLAGVAEHANHSWIEGQTPEGHYKLALPMIEVVQYLQMLPMPR
jgi:hypothetical protein